MSKKTIAAWSLAAVVATTGAVNLFAHESEKGKEEKVTYHSSIQAPAGLEKQSELQKLAKITKEDAVRAAQAAAVGTVSETKLENEDQNLVYTVEITNGNKTTAAMPAPPMKPVSPSTINNLRCVRLFTFGHVFQSSG